MNQITKWTFLFLTCAIVAFGATVLVARGRELAKLLAAERPGAEEWLAETAYDDGAMADEASTVQLSTSENAPVDLELSAGPTDKESAALTALDAEPLNTQAKTLAAIDQPAAGGDEQLAPPGALSAVGAVELDTERQVVLATSGRVDTVAVEEGDLVEAGELIIALDTTYLDWSLEQAEIRFETARINFEELGEEIEESDIAVAEANLLLAQENLADVEEGPTEEEMAAAQSAAAAAWARYEELQEQPTQAQINQALANLRKAEITLQQAQREYDKIAWLPEAAASTAADNLQKATVDYEAAQAAFEEANKPADESALQSALSSAQSAQDNLNTLEKQPTPADLADAQAKVAAAENALQEVQKGPKESELRKAELAVREAMIGLEEARLAKENATVTAPIDGTVLTVNVDLGQQASGGTVVATLGDIRDVKLVVNVEQKDISQVAVGQQVDVSVFALPTELFLGQVEKIAPIANSGTGFVTFPVIIQLTDGPLERLLPGMTASAVFGEPAGTTSAPADETGSDGDASDDAANAEAEAEETPEAAATAEATPTSE